MRLRAPLALAAGFFAGSVPLSNLVAVWRTGTDLRRVGNGTVSGTALARVAGVGPLIAVGILEVARVRSARHLPAETTHWLARSRVAAPSQATTGHPGSGAPAAGVSRRPWGRSS